MYDEIVTILENRKINSKYYKLAFFSQRLQKNVLPGQFLNLKITNGSDPLLRRPFSYYRVKGETVEILYEVLGRGTDMLSGKKAGETLQSLGPLGKSFRMDIGRKQRVLVAGGVGVPPLVFLANKIQDVKPVTFLIGCKSKGEVLPANEFGKFKKCVTYATDDGSYGRKGFVTVLLREILKEKDPKSIFIQTCGPRVMMSEVMKLAREFGVEGEASIDKRMACGVGACLGCMVETKEGRKTSCVDGPVFSFSELVENF